MKVLHVVNAFPDEENRVKGVFIKEQIDSLSDEELAISNDVLYIDAQRNGRLEYFRTIPKLVFLSKSYDVIHAHHVFCSLVCILSGQKNKLVTSFLSDAHNEVMIGPRFIREFLYSLASKFTKFAIYKTHNKAIDGKQSFFCPNAVDFDVFHPIQKNTAREALGLKKEKIYALFISGQSLHRPEKRFDLFNDVINGYNAKYGSDIQKIALSNASRKDLCLYYNACDFYLLTSDFEGSPNAVKECLACQTSVISRDVGSVSHLLNGLNNSYLVESEDPVDYYDSISKVLLNLDDQNEDYPAHLKSLNLEKSSVSELIKGIYGKIKFM
ncbi:glycosyltransferase [Vibrio navarrensis]|uniref:glycosyltransferase n=1 Tax=Vibrio navarrensis TaxID=29495 RepID=UPI001558F3C1|nr:glycosyltransferase [Vibrio navarrensis]